MGEVIYYKKYDEPLVVEYKGRDGQVKQNKVDGAYVCTDERVEKFWIYGGTGISKDSPMVSYAAFMFKNGERYEKQLTTKDWEGEAEKYLSELPE